MIFDENISGEGNLGSYKTVELCSNEELEKFTSSLDNEQRLVLDLAVSYARDLKKHEHGLGKQPAPPLLIVQGGAGSGKSTVIEAICQHVERIFRKPGDNPEMPYILKCAPTGSAAANIEGQTLHSVFSFNFGNEFLTLSDKARDEKRNSFQNLKLLIIDEISMVSADMLYKIDLRLKEIKENMSSQFGGIGVLCFGDLMQLRPVLARYIFDQPRHQSYKIPYMVDPL